MSTEVGQFIQLPRGGPFPMSLDQLGRLGFENFRQGHLAPMSKPAIGKQSEVNDSEFVTIESKTTNVRRKDGRVLQVRGGHETTKSPAGFGVRTRRNCEGPTVACGA